MRKNLVLVFVAMAAFVIAGCGGGKKQASPPASSNSGVSANATSGNDGGGIPIKIAIVSSSGVDDGAFTEDCYKGITAYIKTNPKATFRAIKEPDMGKLIDAAAMIIADYDVLVLPGFQFGAMGAIAENNPDTKLILVDAVPLDKDGGEVVLPNVYGMTFKDQESGFFAGVAAALETKSDKVAVVNGIAFPSNVNFQYGFMAGVNYANKHYGTTAAYIELPSYAGTDVTNANVGGNYIGGFADQATGKVVGTTLINEGVDIIFIAAGNSGLGVFAAAKEASNNVRVIGVDVDQYDQGANGNDNIVLTSALKIMSINVTRQLEAIGKNTFTGKNDLLGASTASTGYVKEAGRNQLTTSTLEKLEEVSKLLGDGSIVPPDNFSGSVTPISFPGL
jgi:basic membrane protein A